MCSQLLLNAENINGTTGLDAFTLYSFSDAVNASRRLFTLQEFHNWVPFKLVGRVFYNVFFLQPTDQAETTTGGVSERH